MRNLIALLSAATLIVACADDPHPTGPDLRSANGNGQPTADKAPVVQAKPTDQVGFTKITQVTGNAITVAAGLNANATATCPAGTTAIAGGHVILLSQSMATAPRLVVSAPDNANGWTVGISNSSPGTAQVEFVAIVKCVS